MGRAGWSVWIVYVLVGTMQVILTIMGIIIKMKGETPARPMDEVQQVRPGPLIKIRFEGSWNTSGQFGSGAGARDGGRRRRSYALLSRGIAPDEKIRPLLLFSDPTLRYTTKNPPVERNLLTSSARSPAPSRLNRGANGGDGVSISPAVNTFQMSPTYLLPLFQHTPSHVSISIILWI